MADIPTFKDLVRRQNTGPEVGTQWSKINVDGFPWPTPTQTVTTTPTGSQTPTPTQTKTRTKSVTQGPNR